MSGNKKLHNLKNGRKLKNLHIWDTDWTEQKYKPWPSFEGALAHHWVTCYFWTDSGFSIIPCKLYTYYNTLGEFIYTTSYLDIAHVHTTADTSLVSSEELCEKRHSSQVPAKWLFFCKYMSCTVGLLIVMKAQNMTSEF